MQQAGPGLGLRSHILQVGMQLALLQGQRILSQALLQQLQADGQRGWRRSAGMRRAHGLAQSIGLAGQALEDGCWRLSHGECFLREGGVWCFRSGYKRGWPP